MFHNKILELIRLETGHEGTIGVLKINKRVFCSTLEPPDLQNARGASNIPAGQYCCGFVLSPKFGPAYEVQNVPGRSSILFHAGNTVDHTQGCILLGQYPGKLRGDRAVLNSGKTFKRFMDIVVDEPQYLTVLECY